MARHDIGQVTTRMQPEHKNHRNREMPDLWINELAGGPPTRPLVEFAISWIPDKDEDRLKNNGVDVDDLKDDFRHGFSIRKAEENGREVFYLWSQDFEMEVDIGNALKSGVKIAMLWKCHPSKKKRNPGPLRGDLTFAAVRDEVKCDLDELIEEANLAQWEQDRYSEKCDAAAAKLQEVLPNPSDRLANLIRNRLRSLVNLLELFEKRSQEQPSPSFFGTVLDPVGTEREEMTTDGKTDSGRVTLLLGSDADELESGSIVEIRVADAKQEDWNRGRILSVDARKLEIELFKPGNFAPDQRAEIRLYIRFDRRNHQIALRNLLEEKTIGYWPALVRLMAAPTELPLTSL